MNKSIVRRTIQVASTLLLQAALLFVAAWTLKWTWAWIFLLTGIMILVINYLVLPREVIEERGKKKDNVKKWDRIQYDREHTVETGGPYRFVRHPGYVGFIVMSVATPLALGSYWALIASGLTAILMVIRTKLEDDTLKNELDGYEEYTRQVRKRLIPWVW